MAICNLCGKESPLIGENLSLCRDCISRDFPGFETVQKIRAASRERVGLPAGDVSLGGGSSPLQCLRK